ncbi:Alpha-(1,3)-fucosyltransferase 7 [Branchiostoma belcheri]|nr:Alpha-(1,3)-fucosyltransferase 7 [Branchiostoma belcheri]
MRLSSSVQRSPSTVTSFLLTTIPCHNITPSGTKKNTTVSTEGTRRPEEDSRLGAVAYIVLPRQACPSMSQCEFTLDRGEIADADGVLFWFRLLPFVYNRSYFPPSRPAHQHWIMRSGDCPYYTRAIDWVSYADDFKTPRVLASYLLHLDKNEDKYMEYLAWRNNPPKNPPDYESHWCELCKKLVHVKTNERKVYNDIDKWWMGPNYEFCEPMISASQPVAHGRERCMPGGGWLGPRQAFEHHLRCSMYYLWSKIGQDHEGFRDPAGRVYLTPEDQPAAIDCVWVRAGPARHGKDPGVQKRRCGSVRFSQLPPAETLESEPDLLLGLAAPRSGGPRGVSSRYPDPAWRIPAVRLAPGQSSLSPLAVTAKGVGRWQAPASLYCAGRPPWNATPIGRRRGVRTRCTSSGRSAATGSTAATSPRKVPGAFGSPEL